MKYLVNNTQIEATSANDAVKKYRLADVGRFPNYVGTPSHSPDIMYSYIDYIEDAIKANNKKLANFYIDRLVSAYYDYDKLEDDFKRFINDYSKAMNDVHTKMRAFQAKVYQMKDSVKDGWLNVRGTTSQGYEVRAIYNGNSGRLYAVIYRPRTNDFLVAAGYNQLRGDWAQGYYDFKSEDQARKFAEKHARQMGDSVKDGDLKSFLSKIAYERYQKGIKNGADFLTWMRKKGYRLDDLDYYLTEHPEVFPSEWKVQDSVKDSDKLKQMAYKFAQMGNYFDRANSAESRKILAKEDAQKYAEFYNFALQVYQQLKTEVDGAKKNATPKQYRLLRNNQTLKLLDDGASRLYWVAGDMNDRKGDLLSKKIKELIKEYENATYDSVKTEDGNAEIIEFMGNSRLVEKFKQIVKYNSRNEVRPILCEEPEFNPKLSENDLKEIARKLNINY